MFQCANSLMSLDFKNDPSLLSNLVVVSKASKSTVKTKDDFQLKKNFKLPYLDFLMC